MLIWFEVLHIIDFSSSTGLTSWFCFAQRVFVPSPANSRRRHSVFRLSVYPSVRPCVCDHILKVCGHDLSYKLLVGISPKVQLRCSWWRLDFEVKKVKDQSHAENKYGKKWLKNHLFKITHFLADVYRSMAHRGRPSCAFQSRTFENQLHPLTLSCQTQLRLTDDIKIAITKLKPRPVEHQLHYILQFAGACAM